MGRALSFVAVRRRRYLLNLPTCESAYENSGTHHAMRGGGVRWRCSPLRRGGRAGFVDQPGAHKMTDCVHQTRDGSTMPIHLVPLQPPMPVHIAPLSHGLDPGGEGTFEHRPRQLGLDRELAVVGHASRHAGPSPATVGAIVQSQHAGLAVARLPIHSQPTSAISLKGAFERWVQGPSSTWLCRRDQYRETTPAE